MRRTTLSYFDFPGGRGEDCRLALYLAGVDFVDDRIPRAQWAERKEQTVWGSVPVLEHQGQRLGQSNAILWFIGQAHGLLPEDPFEAARHLSILAAVEDVRHKLAPTLWMKDPEQKKAAREAIADGWLRDWARRMEACLGEGPFVGGDAIGVVDLKLFVLMKWIIEGGLDHVPAAVFTDQPKMKALYLAVRAHDQVVAWYAR